MLVVRLQLGSKFGKLTVLRYSHKVHKQFNDSKKNYYNYYYECECECGTVKTILASSLTGGNTVSCGCHIKNKIIERNRVHGLSKTKLYKLFHGMKRRCYDLNCRSYKNYGGRGITICQEWLDDFKAFYDWALNNGYEDGLSIERIDVNKPYEPANCCWIPINEQTKNTTRNVFYEFGGKKKILGDWAKEFNLPFTTVRKRLNRGWNLEKALTTPKLR